MSHQFTLSSETPTDHIFVCSVCGTVIGFNKPGFGEPNAIMVGGVPTPPADVDKYVGPCTEEE